MSLQSYSYSVLRYVHDIVTGEFINVGVALFSRDAKFIGAKCRTTIGRVHKIFPGVNGDAFKSLMRHVQKEFAHANDLLSSDASLDRFKSVVDVARAVLPADDSSLQWAPPGSGCTRDAVVELDRLYKRMVLRNDEQQPGPDKRQDNDVWKHFKRSLERRHVLPHLKEKKIAVADDEVTFDHAFKNGIWHCLEPLSFDMSSPENIKEKAHKWLGQISSVKDAPENFRVYFLVGKPENPRFAKAFENALSILRKADDAQLYLEDEAEQLADRLATEIEHHQRSVMQ